MADLLQLLGLLAVVAGFGLIWLPLGVLSAGIVLLLAGLALERRQAPS